LAVAFFSEVSLAHDAQDLTVGLGLGPYASSWGGGVFI